MDRDCPLTAAASDPTAARIRNRFQGGAHSSAHQRCHAIGVRVVHAATFWEGRSEMKKLVVAGALALGLLAASPGSAAASVVWCSWDPLVAIVTPAGHVVLVYDSVWTSNLRSEERR